MLEGGRPHLLGDWGRDVLPLSFVDIAESVPSTSYSEEQEGEEGVTVWSEGVTVCSEGVTVWSEGVTVWSEGVTVCSEGATVWSEGATV